MNKNRYSEVNQYMSLRRILLFSLIITASFYVLYTFTRFFGRPTFADSDKKEERMFDEPRHGDDTLHFDSASRPMKNQGPPRVKGKQFKETKIGYMILLNLPLTFILVLSIFLYNRLIMSIKFKWQRDEVITSVVGSLLIALILSTLFTFIQMKVFPNPPGPPRPKFFHIKSGWLGDLPMVAIAVLACYLLRSLYQQKKVAVENETLRTENLMTRYEALKNQMDPHFLFNSLNTLKSLIATDADKAEDFVQQLSSVLRYTLQNKEVVTLSEEMACVEAYTDMMHIRYGDNLRFEMEIDTKYYDYKVLPFSIQGLIENAIKHNVISGKQPLIIRLSTSSDEKLTVSNTKQPKLTEADGSGIGLANLVERYRIKWNENVEILDNGMIFSVTLPLKHE